MSKKREANETERTYEKMLNIISHQLKASQNYNKVTLHIRMTKITLKKDI